MVSSLGFWDVFFLGVPPTPFRLLGGSAPACISLITTRGAPLCPYSSHGSLTLSLGFKCRPSTDTPHTYILGLHTSPEFQTHVSGCLMDTFTWPNMPQVKLPVITPDSAANCLVAINRTHLS